MGKEMVIVAAEFGVPLPSAAAAKAIVDSTEAKTAMTETIVKGVAMGLEKCTNCRRNLMYKLGAPYTNKDGVVVQGTGLFQDTNDMKKLTSTFMIMAPSDNSGAVSKVKAAESVISDTNTGAAAEIAKSVNADIQSDSSLQASLTKAFETAGVTVQLSEIVVNVTDILSSLKAEAPVTATVEVVKTTTVAPVVGPTVTTDSGASQLAVGASAIAVMVAAALF